MQWTGENGYKAKTYDHTGHHERERSPQELPYRWIRSRFRVDNDGAKSNLSWGCEVNEPEKKQVGNDREECDHPRRCVGEAVFTVATENELEARDNCRGGRNHNKHIDERRADPRTDRERYVIGTGVPVRLIRESVIDQTTSDSLWIIE